MPTSTSVIASTIATLDKDAISNDRHDNDNDNMANTSTGTFTMACLSCLYLWLYGVLRALHRFYSMIRYEGLVRYTSYSWISRYITGSSSSSSSLSDTDPIAKEIQRQVAYLPKLPQHLALVIPSPYVRALNNSTTLESSLNGYYNKGHTQATHTKSSTSPKLRNNKNNKNNSNSKPRRMTKIHIQGVPVSISEEEAALHRLADWICWCLAAGIPQTTLYIPDLYDNDQHDHHHLLPNNVWETCVDRLQKAVIKAELLEASALERFTQGDTTTLLSRSNSASSSIISNNEIAELDEQHHLLGLSSRSHSYSQHHHGIMNKHYEQQQQQQQQQPVDIRVFLASSAFGKEHIARVARVLSEESVIPDLNYLHQRMSVPHFNEPQLLITYDGLHSFAPWHLRLTEFYQVPCRSYDMSGTLKQDDFIEGLYRYAHCSQRFGK
ncbi:hypothetical protein BDF22DRAFT_773085 [Syncephalis plumigaleata]|nr:hypothetical protein BDF22DRAFT_773085 [Syncephalis plumigaleata]